MAEQLKAGVAKVDITPPIGVTMAGYGGRDHPAEGVMAPLYAYAIALEQGDEACAIVVGDLIGIPREVSDAIRSRVGELCDLPPERVMPCATHTHWGPELRWENYLPDHLKATVSQEYIVTVGRKMAGAVAQAWNDREPALALCGTGDPDLISFNRRPVAGDGKVAMSLRMELEQALVASRVGAELAATWEKGAGPGERLSDPLDELDGLRAGVSDHQAPVLKLIRPDGSPLAAMICFGCHPVCGAGEETFYLYSPDYPRYARRVMESLLGCPAAFVLGCAGDQVPLRRQEDARRRIGHSLGAEALRVWELVEGDGIGPLRVSSRTASLPVRELPTVEEAEKELSRYEDPNMSAAVTERQMLRLARQYGDKEALEFEIWAMSLGEAWGLVGLPGEVLSEIGLQIRQGSPFENTAVVSLALESLGYVPTDGAIEEGGYEPSWTPLGKGTEAALVEAGIAALNDVGP